MRLIVLMLIVVAGLGLRVETAWQGTESNLPDSAAYERIARGLEQRGEFEQIGPGTPARPQAASNYSPVCRYLSVVSSRWPEMMTSGWPGSSLP